MTEKGYYQKGMFIVENELFYENNKRLGYFEDEKEDEMKQNNHKKTVDRLNELRDLNIEIKRDNKKLRYEVTHWQKIFDDYRQMVEKTLREQYHWLKNEDKISNHDKTVALLELESISARLGIDLN